MTPIALCLLDQGGEKEEDWQPVVDTKNNTRAGTSRANNRIGSLCVHVGVFVCRARLFARLLMIPSQIMTRARRVYFLLLLCQSAIRKVAFHNFKVLD
jgi:hypothetical protein